MTSTVHQTIKDYLTSNDEADQKQAIKTSASIVEEILQGTADESAMEERLWSLWRAVISAAKSTSYQDHHQKQKLAQYVLDLQARQTPSTPRSDQPSVQDMKLWSDLPIFGWALRDAWNVTITDSSTEQERSEWSNLNAWTAALAEQAYQARKDEPDVSLFGLWTIRTALEEKTDTPPDASIIAANVWLRDAAAALSAVSRSEKTFEGKLAKPGPRFSDEQWRGFHVQRWDKWGQRLEELQTGTTDSRTSTIVREAQEAMRNASAK